MIGKTPVNIPFPVHIVVKLIQILLCQKASGIGLASPLLINGIINLHVGVHSLKFIIKNTESLHIGAHIHIQRRGVHIPPGGPGIDLIAQNPVINLTMSGLPGIPLSQKGARRFQMLHAAILFHVQCIAGALCPVSCQRMHQILRPLGAAPV